MQVLQVLLESAEVKAYVEDGGLLQFLSGAADASLVAPATLRKGDIHTCMFRVQGTAPAVGARLGVLLLRWRRKGYGPPC